jgi:hypothetical protein
MDIDPAIAVAATAPMANGAVTAMINTPFSWISSLTP